MPRLGPRGVGGECLWLQIEQGAPRQGTRRDARTFHGLRQFFQVVYAGMQLKISEQFALSFIQLFALDAALKFHAQAGSGRAERVAIGQVLFLLDQPLALHRFEQAFRRGMLAFEALPRSARGAPVSAGFRRWGPRSPRPSAVAGRPRGRDRSASKSSTCELRRSAAPWRATRHPAARSNIPPPSGPNRAVLCQKQALRRATGALLLFRLRGGWLCAFKMTPVILRDPKGTTIRHPGFAR